jgi:hypothetical protein
VKGRIALSAVAASAASVEVAGSRLTAAAAAEVAHTLRYDGIDSISLMMILPVVTSGILTLFRCDRYPTIGRKRPYQSMVGIKPPQFRPVTTRTLGQGVKANSEFSRRITLSLMHAKSLAMSSTRGVRRMPHQSHQGINKIS